jgi:hypothetical protein
MYCTLGAEIDFFERCKMKRASVLHVVMTVLGMVAEKSRVVRSQKRRSLRYTVWCCCAWSSLIFIPVLDREREAMARDSDHAGRKVDRHVIVLSRRQSVSLRLLFIYAARSGLAIIATYFHTQPSLRG